MGYCTAACQLGQRRADAASIYPSTLAGGSSDAAQSSTDMRPREKAITCWLLSLPGDRIYEGSFHHAQAHRHRPRAGRERGVPADHMVPTLAALTASRYRAREARTGVSTRGRSSSTARSAETSSRRL